MKKYIIVVWNQIHRLKVYKSLNTFVTDMTKQSMTNLTEIKKSVKELKKVEDTFDRYMVIHYASGYREEIRIQKIAVI